MEGMLRVNVDSLGWGGDSVFQGEAVADSCAPPHAKGRGPVAGGRVRADGGAQKHQGIAAAPCPRGRGYLRRRLRRAQKERHRQLCSLSHGEKTGSARVGPCSGRATATTLQPPNATVRDSRSSLAQAERRQRPDGLQDRVRDSKGGVLSKSGENHTDRGQAGRCVLRFDGATLRYGA